MHFNKKALTIIFSIVLVSVFFFSVPASAVSNPDGIAIYSYEAFENIFEDGDMLFVAYYNVEYSSEPSEDADYTFSFNLYSENGTTLLLSRPLNYYQCNVISIYASTEQVIDMGLVYGNSYVLKIAGNPSFFSSLTEGLNIITRTLSSGNWNTDDVVTAKEHLKEYCIDIASELESDWGITLLTTTTEGDQVLNVSGTIAFSDAIPNLQYAIPNLFYLSSSFVIINKQSSNLTMANESTIENKLGTQISDAFAGIGEFLGISEQLTAGLWIMLLILSIASIVFLASGNSTGAIVLCIPLVIMGGYLGAIPWTVIFTIGFLVIAYTFYFLWLRGT
jgi:hypothetical protein